jgi:hypothetical protein
VANQRASDQVFVGIWISSSLAGKLEARRNGVPRSQFVRDALADYLGIPNSPEKNAPDRVKKPLPPERAMAAAPSRTQSSSSVRAKKPLGSPHTAQLLREFDKGRDRASHPK